MNCCKKKKITEILCVKIDECELFIDENDFFLVATPNGLIRDNRVVEIKCPYSTENLNLDEAI